LHAEGRPLDPALRAEMEPRFQHDFSRVRIHTDSEAAESAQAVNAAAFTVGRDVVFGSGQFNPQTGKGRRLISHELAHTIQQRDGEPQSPVRAGGAGPEREADRAAAAVVSGGRAAVASGSVPPSLARQPEPLVNREMVFPSGTFLRELHTSAEPERFRWPAYSGHSALLSSDEQKLLQDVVAHRQSLSTSSSLRTVPFHPTKNTTTYGYQYLGRKASPLSPATDPIHKLALAEFGLGEGGVSAVVTYDTTLSLGAGFADAASPQWMRDWFDHDKAVEATFEEAGLSVTRGGMWLAVNDSANIISGNAARVFIRGNPQLLSLYMSLSEDPAHTQIGAQAQQDWVKKWEIDKIDPALRAEMNTWPRGAVASALHLSHWLPAGGPVWHPKRFIGSGGNAVALAKAFALNLAAEKVVRTGVNGAVVVGATEMTSQAVEHYFRSFGVGAGPKETGYIERGLSAIPRIPLRVADAYTDARLSNHVLYLQHIFDSTNTGPVSLIDLGP